MIKEGLPNPSRLFSSIATCSLDQHNEVLKRILTIEHQGTEKFQSEDDTVSQMKFSFYVCTWYVFYRADPPFLQISLFFMHLHRPPEHRRPTHRSSEYRYCPFEHRLTIVHLLPTECRLLVLLDKRPIAYQRIAFRLLDYLHQFSDYQLTNYRPTDYQHTGYQPTDHQSTDFQPTENRTTGTAYPPPTAYQTTDHQPNDYQQPTNSWSTDFCPILHCPPMNQSTTVQGHPSTCLLYTSPSPRDV
jgi:hypothetical protein